jgi:chromosome segregation ATPase
MTYTEDSLKVSENDDGTLCVEWDSNDPKYAIFNTMTENEVISLKRWKNSSNNMNLQDRKYMAQYSDEELMKMEYNAMKQERDSWRRNFEELKVKYEELQNIYVETEDELNEYRNKFIDESLQHNYLKNDYDYLQRDMNEVKARLSVLEAFMRSNNGWSA